MKKLLMSALLLSACVFSMSVEARGGGGHGGGGHSSGGHSSSHSSFSHSSYSSHSSSGSRSGLFSSSKKSTSSFFGSSSSSRRRSSLWSRGSTSSYRPYSYRYGMYHPFYPYHSYGRGSNYSQYKDLTLQEWLKTTSKTRLYMNKFSSLDQFENKAKLNCAGSLYGCKNNTNLVSHDYDVALNAGFKDATRLSFKTYGTPDINSSRYHKLRASYHRNKYRVDALGKANFSDLERANTIKNAYFLGYAAGLYTTKNNIR